MYTSMYMILKMTIEQCLDHMIPGEENIDPGVGGDDDDERDEEDLAVVQRVVDVRPVVRPEKKLLTSQILFRIILFGNLVSRECIYKKMANIPLYKLIRPLS